MLILSDTQAIILFLIIWLLPFIIFIRLVRKANKILKENNGNLNSYMFNRDVEIFILLFLLPMANYIVLMFFYFDEIKPIFEKNNNHNSFFGIKFFGIKSVNGKKIGFGQLFKKLFNQ